MKHIKRNQSGFTLVEIAIVLVIIGLLLGGVLKGQEMIENARIKAVVNDLTGVSAAYNGYLDRFHAIPGDESNLTMNNRGWLGTVGGNGNGVLTILPAATFTNAGEQTAMWRALRGSGLAAGDPAAPAGVANLPRSGTGGILGVSVGPYALTGVSACVSGLTTKQASGVDVIIDGPLPVNQIGNSVGSGARGDTAAIASAPVPTGLAYNETITNVPWIMCRPL